ncbi:ATP-binding protein [Glaciibacter flavus]|uniref:ATP-binding protein n=1 Tax=Orlajensenia flava TaxID=2565934 RepID=UPI003AFF8E4A
MNRLIGRDNDLDRLRHIIDHAEIAGRAVIISGDAGIGKTRLLQTAVEHARHRGRRVLHVTGVEPECHLPYAGLQQLLGPVLSSAGMLPTVRRRAILTALGLDDGPAPQPFLVGLATHDLLSAAAARTPLMVAIDDTQWLDDPTQSVLSFTARRVHDHAMTMIASIRSGHPSPLLRAGLDVLTLEALDDRAANEVLDEHAPELSESMRRRVLTQSDGNPLALIELPTAVGQEWSLSDWGNESTLPLTARLEESFASRLEEVSKTARDVLLVAAVNDDGSLQEILAAAEALHEGPVEIESLDSATAAGLVNYDLRSVRFRHPLVRSAVVQRESADRRRAAHAALAQVLGAQPFRRAWHLGRSTIGVDDAVADALEASHVVALQRGSVASSIQALQRSAELTGDSGRRGRRLLMAGAGAFKIGRADLVGEFVEAAAREELQDLDRARLELLRESYTDGVPGDAKRVHELCNLADQSASTGDIDLALDLLMGAALRCWWADAGPAAQDDVVAVAELIAGTNPGTASDPRYVAVLAVANPVSNAARVAELLEAVNLETASSAESLRLFAMAAHAVGDPIRMVDFATRASTMLRDQGSLGLLSHVLTMQILDHVELGTWRAAASCIDEGHRVAQETGQDWWANGTRILSAIPVALSGDYGEAIRLAAQGEQETISRQLSDLRACVQLARGFAAVAVGRYAEGYIELRRVFDRNEAAFHQTERYHAISLLAEAAARCNRKEEAAEVLSLLEQELGESPAPTPQVHLAYARAVLAPDDEAEHLFDRALSNDLVRWPWPRARLQLAYGTWLRRRRRIAESRIPLRAALAALEVIGASTWAEQARGELRATGERPADHDEPSALELLSAQELQIASLAASGLSNREIGERLFLSPRTVGSHLYRLFPKLGITSRAQLAGRLSRI